MRVQTIIDIVDANLPPINGFTIAKNSVKVLPPDGVL